MEYPRQFVRCGEMVLLHRTILLKLGGARHHTPSVRSCLFESDIKKIVVPTLNVPLGSGKVPRINDHECRWLLLLDNRDFGSVLHCKRFVLAKITSGICAKPSASKSAGSIIAN